MASSAGSLVAVALHERDLGLLKHPSTQGIGNILLVVETTNMRKVMNAVGNNPRVVQVLQMSDPDAPSTADSRIFREFCRKGYFKSAEVWRDAPNKPFKFNDKANCPDVMLAFSGYRFLRRAGFGDITLRAQDWSDTVAPFPMLEDFVDKHKGERCFVVGNGPSLNDIDMTLLKDEVTFGSNRVFLGYEKWGFEFTYWGMEDRLQVEGYHDEYEAGVPDQTPKFIPFDYVTFSKMPNTTYMPLLYGNGRTLPGQLKFPAFSNKPDRIFHGFTITYSLIQLAALMGFSEIYLIGTDHNYGLGAQKLSTTAAGGDGQTWSADDAAVATHFDSSYTTGNKQFVKPRPVNAEIAYACARQWCDMRDLKIRNATPGSHLDVYERVDFASLF
jgi:hypothetical protein